MAPLFFSDLPISPAKNSVIKSHLLVVNRFSGYQVWVLFALVLLLTALVYSGGLSGPFVFDDAINIVNNQNLRIDDLKWSSLYRAGTSIPNGMFGRPLSMLSFAADFYWDRDIVSPFPIPYTFKLTNLLIHLANGLGVFTVTLLLVRATSDLRDAPYPRSYAHWLALVVTAAWLLHPLNLTGVLYVVQRMTSLATLFTVSGMVCYLIGRRRLSGGHGGAKAFMVAALLVFAPLAFLCKEIGVLLPVYILLIELFLFRRKALTSSQNRVLKVYFATLVLLPALIILFLCMTHADWLLNAYSRRDFTLAERLMTESRVIWFYAQQTLLPNIASMGLFHDDFAISRGFFNPTSTAIATIALIAYLIAIYLVNKVQPLIAFGLAFFLLGHSLESTVIPLELIHEHRNYLPGLGLLLALFHVLLGPDTTTSARVWRRIGAVALLLLFVTITQSRVVEWSSSQKLWDAETMHHPDSVRSQLARGSFYANALTFNPIERENNYASAIEAFDHALQLDRKSTIALFGILRLGKTFERPVDARYIEELKYGLQKGSIAPDTNDRLIDLALCIGQPHCPVTAKQYESLLEAALDNAKLQGRDKALIYSAKTYYLTHIAHDYSSALASTRQAIALDGDIEHQMWLAAILIAMHDAHAAKLQIDLLRQLDLHHTREKDISNLELQNSTESR